MKEIFVKIHFYLNYRKGYMNILLNKYFKNNPNNVVYDADFLKTRLLK